jgi:porphobilinogen synthase
MTTTPFVQSNPVALRPRRLRLTSAIRLLVRETDLDARQLIAPLFVTETSPTPRAVTSMPGVSQWPIDHVAAEAAKLYRLGVRAVLLFGIPAQKDAEGSGSFAADGVVQQAVQAIKARVPEMVVITDVCLCEYTDHGHCGLLNGSTPDLINPHLPDAYVLNDESVEVLGRIAVSQAAAGADIVAPSAMLDGMVAGIRASLDGAGFSHVPIMSYSAKYASSFYGPFREAAQGAPKQGDRQSHQLDPANAREALKENALDVREGADLLLIKPALPYLDIIRASRDQFPELPLVAYNVSGEYAMVKAAAQRGWLDERRAVLEILTGIRRAGADLIVTYHAADAARWLAEA